MCRGRQEEEDKAEKKRQVGGQDAADAALATAPADERGLTICPVSYDWWMQTEEEKQLRKEQEEEEKKEEAARREEEEKARAKA